MPREHLIQRVTRDRYHLDDAGFRGSSLCSKGICCFGFRHQRNRFSMRRSCFGEPMANGHIENRNAIGFLIAVRRENRRSRR